jgi:K+ transporter
MRVAAGAAGSDHGRTGDTSFYLGRETLLTTRPRRPGALAQEPLRLPLAQRAAGQHVLFQIPPNRVIELGTQVEL